MASIAPTSIDVAAPIIRRTSEDRLLEFTNNANSIYKRYSVYDGQGDSGIKLGFKQPYVFTNVASSNLEKNATRFDSTTFPIGSTAFDVIRTSKFLASISGVKFATTQALLQQQNAFNETRIYNPLSIPQASARPATFGGIPRPTRFFGDFIPRGDISLSSASSTGYSNKVSDANGKSLKDSPLLPKYAGSSGQMAKGLVRSETGARAQSTFDLTWSGGKGTGQTLLDRAKSMLPSTRPYLIGKKWGIRPEYPESGDSVFDQMLIDRNQNLKDFSTEKNVKNQKNLVVDFHKYDSTDKYVVSTRSSKLWPKEGFPLKVENDNLPLTSSAATSLTNKLEESIKTWEIGTQFVYKSNPPTYESRNNGNSYVNVNEFSSATSFDGINTLGVLNGKDSFSSSLLALDKIQSKDIIFFHFKDLVNDTYIPFRATVSSISENNSAEWESISYIGRADKIFMYTGFTRSTNVSFTVYANGIGELIPMWERISYLVGLTMPSKYTPDSSTKTNSEFICPPMVSLRLGDLYQDQPVVINSVTINVPDDTNWETLIGDSVNIYETYLTLVKDRTPMRGLTSVRSRQLPLKVDVSVTMNILEKERPRVDLNHYGIG